MISQQNFDLVRPFLKYQIKDRGLNISISRENWDTFNGWKKRGKSICKGSMGFRVELVVPYTASKIKNKTKVGFATRQKVLFSGDQTL